MSGQNKNQINKLAKYGSMKPRSSTIYERSKDTGDWKLKVTVNTVNQNWLKFTVGPTDQPQDTFEIPSQGAKQWAVYLFEENYSFELIQYKANSTEVLARYYFAIMHEQGDSIGNMWKALTSRFGNMSSSDVRFYNQGYTAAREPSALQQRFNLRSQATINAVHIGGFVLPHSGVAIIYVNAFVEQLIVEGLSWATAEKRKEHTVGLPQRFNARADSTAQSEPQKCGQCKEGETPLGISNIRTKLYRKTWVGCQMGEKCLSTNYWFHFKCADCQWEDVKGKKNGWWCPKCRGSDQNGHGLGRINY